MGCTEKESARASCGVNHSFTWLGIYACKQDLDGWSGREKLAFLPTGVGPPEALIGIAD